MRSRYVAQALQEIGATVEIFEPHFASDTPDTVWLPEVSQRGWFVLTKDDNIGRNPLEQIALPSAHGTCPHNPKPEFSYLRSAT